MKNFFFLIIILVLSNNISAKDIEGKWLFKTIQSSKKTSVKNLKPIKEGDFMLIEKDGSFKYELKEIGLNAEGNWKIEKDLLLLDYTLPKDTIRTYKISLSKNTLVLNENYINFSFEREVLNPIQTSGISIKSNSAP